MGNAKTNLEYLKTTKSLIKQAIIDKGVEVSDTDTFRSYKDKIADISSGGGTVPDISDIHLSLTNVDKTIDENGITIRPNSSYKCYINSVYDSTGGSYNIPLDKDLTHYELSLNIIPYYVNNYIFGTIVWRGYAEQGFMAQSGYTMNSTDSWVQAKYSYNSTTGDKIYYTYGSNIIVKYTFADSSSNNITANISVDNGETFAQRTYTESTLPSSISQIQGLCLLGDCWDDGYSSNRYCDGKILFKNTYIKDLDTEAKVWELVDGRS